MSTISSQIHKKHHQTNMVRFQSDDRHQIKPRHLRQNMNRHDIQDRLRSNQTQQNPHSRITFPSQLCSTPELPGNFMQMISDIISTDPPAPLPTPFNFQLTKEAADHNSTILQQYDYDMVKTIAAHPCSHISYGSEFRAPSQLHQLLHRSPF